MNPKTSSELKDESEDFEKADLTLRVSSACFQPLFGQTANIFGRRWLMIGAVAFFVLGSGISGGAINSAMMVAGRAIQGIGGGGINVLIELIVSDLVPLRERGNFMAMIFAVFSIGTSLGPFVGGALVQHSSWRWVFYLNLPIGGTALVRLFFFLHVNYKQEPWEEKIKKIDYFGNALLMTSIVSILLALTWAGFVGMIIFHIYEASPWYPEPMMPPRIFGNRTSFAALILSFIHNMLTFWVVYFMPVYFQSVKLSTSTRAGVQFLPTGFYKPIHIFGMGLSLVGLGLFTLLDADSSDGKWIVYQIITAIGLDSSVAAQLGGGEAYSHVSANFIRSLEPQVRDEVMSVYSDTLKLVWQVSLGFAALGFIVIWFERQIKLRTELETEYGIQVPKEDKDNKEAVEA
ncbi:uncharacterized protein N7518_001323 [Penicillium psychrosexuale]|uniref:uncharacterized protein n=1 Tax=Penicillium psychrosexuale TaxID=1002107 RepID=UPI0025459121|nr:uncharacterized protein N7518_001323 [Penicillium psychrosexuale]KAJ5799255.1 hypothetical protein N7518_001323 [Penicillium psychrosexuale]